MLFHACALAIAIQRSMYRLYTATLIYYVFIFPSKFIQISGRYFFHNFCTDCFSLGGNIGRHSFSGMFEYNII